MTARFRDFGDDNEETPREPITFRLKGEEFTALPEIQGALLLDLARKAQGDSAEAAAIILDFFKNVLEDESYERFDALLHSKKIVKVEKLGEIVGWLMEEYTNRPEGQQEASSVGR